MDEGNRDRKKVIVCSVIGRLLWSTFFPYFKARLRSKNGGEFLTSCAYCVPKKGEPLHSTAQSCWYPVVARTCGDTDVHETFVVFGRGSAVSFQCRDVAHNVWPRVFAPTEANFPYLSEEEFRLFLYK